jgi:hypothetical protein
VIDVQRAADLLFQLLDRRFLGRQAADVGAGAGAEEHTGRGLGRRCRRRGRGGERDGLGFRLVVAPEGEGGDPGEAECTDHEHGDTGPGREEVPEPAGNGGRHD